MARATYLPAVIALCLLAGCNKSEPETGAAPAQDTTAAAGQMAKDSTSMTTDSTMSDSATMADTTHMKADSTSMPMDSTMQMPADSTKQ
jgi:hypothetical protein